MKDSNNKDIFNSWRKKSIKEGFTLNQFRAHYSKYVEAKETCSMTKAIGARMAYKSLVESRNVEFKTMKREMENIRWIF